MGLLSLHASFHIMHMFFAIRIDSQDGSLGAHSRAGLSLCCLNADLQPQVWHGHIVTRRHCVPGVGWTITVDDNEKCCIRARAACEEGAGYLLAF